MANKRCLGLLPLLLLVAGCATLDPGSSSRLVVVYDNEIIEGNGAIWNQQGLAVDGFRFVHVFVEFEQHASSEDPISVGVGFAPWPMGRAGSRRYYNFESPPELTESLPPEVEPRWIGVMGEGSWHGEPHDVASFIIRAPVMGPYMWVYPLNHHEEARHVTIVVYLVR